MLLITKTKAINKKVKDMGLYKNTNQSPLDTINALRRYSSNNAPTTNPMASGVGLQSSNLKIYPSKANGNNNRTPVQLLLI